MNKMIRIIAPGPLGSGVRIETAEGAPISGITECDIWIRVDGIVTASIEVVTAMVDVKAHPMLGLETVRAAAEFYGFRLVDKGDAA